jgi:GNAT superfamily N-acetyltransferase
LLTRGQGCRAGGKHMLERWKTAIMVRLARAGDDLRCAEIFLASRRAAFHWQPAAPFDLEDYRRSVEDEEVWVAEMGGLVVGFASIYHPAGFIQNLFVDPDWQHHGVGTLLLERACAHLSRPARLRCLAANQSARAFYERNGWVIEAPPIPPEDPFILYRK